MNHLDILEKGVGAELLSIWGASSDALELG